jgi:hypothetical protein
MSDSKQLDLISVRKAYKLLLNLSPASKFVHVLTNAMEILLAKIIQISNTKKLRDPKLSGILNVLLICVEVHFIYLI